VPSSRITLITPKTLVSSPTDYASSGSGSEHRTVTYAELATDPTQLTSSRACHRHVTAAPPTTPSSSASLLQVAATTWMNIVLELASRAVRSRIQFFRMNGVSTPIYETWSTQLGTSQGAKTVKSTLGPDEGTFSARASKAVGRWLCLPGKACYASLSVVRLGLV
jgi:hypothetical protein